MSKYVYVEHIFGGHLKRARIDIWAQRRDDAAVADYNLSYEARCQCGTSARRWTLSETVKWAEAHRDAHCDEQVSDSPIGPDWGAGASTGRSVWRRCSLSAEENKAIVRRLYEEVVDHGDLSLVLQSPFSKSAAPPRSANGQWPARGTGASNFSAA